MTSLVLFIFSAFKGLELWWPRLDFTDFQRILGDDYFIVAFAESAWAHLCFFFYLSRVPYLPRPLLSFPDRVI